MKAVISGFHKQSYLIIRKQFKMLQDTTWQTNPIRWGKENLSRRILHFLSSAVLMPARAEERVAAFTFVKILSCQLVFFIYFFKKPSSHYIPQGKASNDISSRGWYSFPFTPEVCLENVGNLDHNRIQSLPQSSPNTPPEPTAEAVMTYHSWQVNFPLKVSAKSPFTHPWNHWIWPKSDR